MSMVNFALGLDWPVKLIVMSFPGLSLPGTLLPVFRRDVAIAGYTC